MIDKDLEIKKLKEQLATAQNRTAPNKYMDELSAIRQKATVEANRIVVKDFEDHKNIALYHTNGLHIGKKVGPLHQTNATATLEKFYNNGIMLSVTKPTDSEIDAYKATPEWKSLRKVFDKTRSDKLKTRKKSEIDKLAKAIEGLGGQRVTNALQEKAGV